MAVAEFEVKIDLDTKKIISSIAQVNNAFKTALSNINTAIDEVNSGWKAFIKSTEKKIKEPDFKPPDIDKATKEFDKNSKEISKDIDDINKDWEGFKKDVEKPVVPKMDPKPIKKDFAAISAAASIAGQNMTQMLTQPILDFGKTVLDVGQDYSKAMGMLSGVTDGTEETMSKLQDKSMEVGRDSLFSSTEAAEGMYFLGSAGYSTEDIMNSLDGTMNLATAGSLDLARASEIVTGAMTAMGVESKDTNMFVDTLAKTAAGTNTSIEEMGGAFEYVAPIAGTLGYSIQDVSLALGIMANSGIKGEKAGTALRGALTKLAAPTGEAADLVKKLGIEMVDSQGNALPLKDVLDNLRTSFQGLSQEQQTQYAQTLFGQEAMGGMLAIINSSPEQYDALTDSIQNADGKAQSMADTMEDTSPIDKMNAGIETMMTSISENLAPMIDGIATAIGNLVSWFGELDPAIQGGILAFLGLLALIGPVLSFIGVLGLIAGAVGTTMGIVAITVGWVVLAILAVIAIGVLLWMFWDDIANFFVGIGKWFVDVWNGVGKFFEGLGQWFGEIWNGIVGFFIWAGQFIINYWKGIFSFFAKLPGMIASFFSKIPYWIGYAIGLYIGYIAKVSLIIWNFVTVTIPQFVMGVLKWFYELPGKIWNALLQVMAQISAWFSSMWNTAKTEVPKLINGIITWFSELPGKIWKWLVDVINKIGAWFSGMWNMAKTEIPKLISNIVQWFANLPKNMLEIGQNIVRGIWDGIVNMTNWIIGKVKEFAKGIMDGIKAAMGIASPSKITTKFGEYLAEGLGIGFGDEIKNVYSQMDKAISLGNSKLDTTVQIGMEQTSDDLSQSSQLGMNAMNGNTNQTTSTYNAPNNVVINVRSPSEAVKEIRVLNKQMALGW